MWRSIAACWLWTASQITFSAQKSDDEVKVKAWISIHREDLFANWTLLVEQGTLAEFRYLENGAFWSILVLSVVMFAQTMWKIPEAATGLLGAGFIGTAFISSLLWNRRNAA